MSTVGPIVLADYTGVVTEAGVEMVEEVAAGNTRYLL